MNMKCTVALCLLYKNRLLPLGILCLLNCNSFIPGLKCSQTKLICSLQFDKATSPGELLGSSKHDDVTSLSSQHSLLRTISPPGKVESLGLNLHEWPCQTEHTIVAPSKNKVKGYWSIKLVGCFNLFVLTLSYIIVTSMVVHESM